MPERRNATLEFISNGSGVEPQYVVRPGRRHGTWIRFREVDVPPEFRMGGRVEIERQAKGVRDAWRIVGPAA